MLSSSYAFAHRLRSRNDAPRVCYCHSPLRFAWSMTEDYREERAGNALAGRAFDLLAGQMRRSDKRSAQAIREYLTQSPFTAEQINAATYETLKANNIADGYVRPLAWRGSEQMGVTARAAKINVAIATWVWPSYFTLEARLKGLILRIQARREAGEKPHVESAAP